MDVDVEIIVMYMIFVFELWQDLFECVDGYGKIDVFGIVVYCGRDVDYLFGSVDQWIV